MTTVTTRVPPSGSAAYVLDAPSLPPLLQLSLPQLAKGPLMELNLTRIGEQTSFAVPVSDEYPGIDELNGVVAVAVDDGAKEQKDGQEGTAAATAATAAASSSSSAATASATRAPLRIFCLVEAEGPTKVITFAEAPLLSAEVALVEQSSTTGKERLRLSVPHLGISLIDDSCAAASPSRLLASSQGWKPRPRTRSPNLDHAAPDRHMGPSVLLCHSSRIFVRAPVPPGTQAAGAALRLRAVAAARGRSLGGGR